MAIARRAYPRSAVVVVGCSGTSRCLCCLRSDVHRAVVEVDIVAVEAERFAGPHAGGRDQTDHRLQRRRAQWGVSSAAACISAAISAGE